MLGQDLNHNLGELKADMKAQAMNEPPQPLHTSWKENGGCGQGGGQAFTVSHRTFTPGLHILPACVSAFRIPCEDADAFNRKGCGSPRAPEPTRIHQEQTAPKEQSPEGKPTISV